MTMPLLAGAGLRVSFPVGNRHLVAVDDVSLTVDANETVALVGESGSGKSTVALTLARARDPQVGTVHFDGTEVTALHGRALRPFRRRLQLILQNPYASLDPRFTVHDVIAEPLRVHRWGTSTEITRRVETLLDQVGLPATAARRYPVQFSGGQRQRISIARALALGPDLVIADEPVSALDVSIQAQIVNLLAEIQEASGVAYLVIAHDLALVHQIANRVLVMYLGRVVESGPVDDVVAMPLHPYTAALLSATPLPDRERRRHRIVLRGEPPSAIDRPTGCPFHPRCPIARDRCAVETPVLAEGAPGRRVACFYPGEIGPVLDLRRAADAAAAGGSMEVTWQPSS
jgi:oligopeptide/dipeptide ABC transporter ATP-binding protein